MKDIKDINVKDSTAKIKDYVQKMPKKTKSLLIAVAGAIVALAVIVAVVLNVVSGNYVSLYTNLSASESASVYQALLDMGADVKVASDGSIQVPKSEYDIWILQLAAKGYPQSALPYDIFSSHSGMTTTESEKKQWLLYQLQDRIQSTLERMDCVDSATVTINVPEKSDYVWDTATDEEKASAGVLLTLTPSTKISGDQVSAIRNLIAASVPSMEAENVKVVDSSTMLELSASSGSGEAGSTGNLDFELQVQSQIEANIQRLLAPRYGTDGVVAVAKVTIDYDKMMTEKYEVTPNEDGGGNLTHSDGSYSVNGTESAGDIAGEENNTDVPEYAYTSPSADGGMTDYTWSKDYDYSYIKTQVESGNAILKRATVSVLVNEKALTEDKKTELTSLISGCTDIPTELVYVSAFTLPVVTDNGGNTDTNNGSSIPENPNFDFLNLPTWVYIAAGVGLLLLLVMILVVVTILKSRKKARLRTLAEAQERTRIEEQKRQREEIENYKHSLEAMAKGNIDPKDEAIMDEVRTFARDNPQITANLLRSWLKEE